MPTKPSFTIAGQLNAAQLAVSNSLADGEIQELVAAYGYSTERLNAGQTLLEAAQAAVTAQKAAAGLQKQATQEMAAARAAAWDAYVSLSKVARAIFKEDRARLTALGLSGAASQSIAEFLAAAVTLFDNAATADTLADFGYDAARLEAERAKIEALDLANQKQEAAKGAAQQATREQVAALAALDAWRAQYIKIARVALRGKKQLLEKIGVPARTTRRRIPKPAPAE